MYGVRIVFLLITFNTFTIEQEDPQERIQHQVNQLYEAIRRGDWRSIGELLTIISPDKYIDETQLALAKAIEIADVTAVELLLGQTGLSKQYIQSMDPKKAKLLPPIGVNVAFGYDQGDMLSGFTPLTLAKALMMGKTVVGIKELQERERGKRTKRTDNLQQIISLLLEAIVIDNRITTKDVHNPINHQFYQVLGYTMNYNTPLCWAVSFQNYQAIDAALALGATFNFGDIDKNIPLNIAVNMQAQELVKHLLQKGANPNLKGIGGQTSLLRAVLIEDVSIIELLMEYGAQVDIPDNRGRQTSFSQAMIIAIKNNNFGPLDAILKSGKVNLNKLQAVIGTPLLFAIDKHSSALVQYLINKGADVNYQPADRARLLTQAILDNNKEIVELLLGAKADIYAEEKGINAIVYAALMGPEMLELIISKGKADINKPNSKGQTPLEVLMFSFPVGKMFRPVIPAAIELLKKYGAKAKEEPIAQTEEE
jgi:ankyrin repeat protein